MFFLQLAVIMDVFSVCVCVHILCLLDLPERLFELQFLKLPEVGGLSSPALPTGDVEGAGLPLNSSVCRSCLLLFLLLRGAEGDGDRSHS